MLAVKEHPSIVAARAAGCSSWRIIIKHIPPNVMLLVYVNTATKIADAILIEAGLSFLGLGDLKRYKLGFDVILR